MSIEAIGAVAEGANIAEMASLTPAEADNSSFVNWLSNEMAAVNQQIQGAELQVQQLATGEQDNLHQVMLSLEKAKLGFELAVQVRNRLLEGYQEIMRMQV